MPAVTVNECAAPPQRSSCPSACPCKWPTYRWVVQLYECGLVQRSLTRSRQGCGIVFSQSHVVRLRLSRDPWHRQSVCSRPHSWRAWLPTAAVFRDHVDRDHGDQAFQSGSSETQVGGKGDKICQSVTAWLHCLPLSLLMVAWLLQRSRAIIADAVCPSYSGVLSL